MDVKICNKLNGYVSEIVDKNNLTGKKKVLNSYLRHVACGQNCTSPVKNLLQIICSFFMRGLFQMKIFPILLVKIALLTRKYFFKFFDEFVQKYKIKNLIACKNSIVKYFATF